MIKMARVLCVLLLFAPLMVHAHSRSESFSEWSWQGNVISYSFSVLQREATRIPVAVDSKVSLKEVLALHLSDNLSVQVANQICPVDQRATALPSRGGFLRVEGRFVCPDSVAPEIHLSAFFDYVPTHTHYAKFRLGRSSPETLFADPVGENSVDESSKNKSFINKSAIDNGRENNGRENNDFGINRSEGRPALDKSAVKIIEVLFTHGQQTQVLRSSAQSNLSSWQAFTEYLWIGAEHILGGIDHLAFVMALLLVATGFKEMAWLITGFTLGHSLSLIVAVLGIAEPNSVMVEALIGFTIALVAVEASAEKTNRLASMALWLPLLCFALLLPLWLMHKPLLVLGVLGIALFSFCYFHLLSRSAARSSLRILITLVFGTIHGFGFAGGLLETGFPAEKMALVLLGFNLGVELGQLLVLALVVGLMSLLRRRLADAWARGFGNAALMALSGLGVFWFVSRLLA